MNTIYFKIEFSIRLLKAEKEVLTSILPMFNMRNIVVRDYNNQKYYCYNLSESSFIELHSVSNVIFLDEVVVNFIKKYMAATT